MKSRSGGVEGEGKEEWNEYHELKRGTGKDEREEEKKIEAVDI